jgi:hypothetical protein
MMAGRAVQYRGRNGKENHMAERKHNPFRRLRVKKGDDLKTIYAKVKRSFTAADLQSFTEIDEGIPAEEILEKLEAMVKKQPGKRKKI